MSAGPFEQGVYQADSGELHVVRYQPETTAATFGTVPNTIASGAPTSEFWVKITKGATEYGLQVRRIRLRWTGDVPAGYKPDVSFEVVVMTTAVFNGATLNGGAVYLGEGCQIIGKLPERMYPSI